MIVRCQSSSKVNFTIQLGDLNVVCDYMLGGKWPTRKTNECCRYEMRILWRVNTQNKTGLKIQSLERY